MIKFKRNIAVDFDGVLNNYTGYDPHNLFTPREGCKEFLKELNKEFDVIIYSTRDSSNIVKWLEHYRLDQYVKAVTNKKPPAVAYIDDRAIRFTGSYEDCLNRLEVKAYWQKEGEY